MLITNSSLVVSHNLIQKYKQILVNKGFKAFVNKKNTFFLKKTHKKKKWEKKDMKEIKN